jgi:hypothetical protein
VRWKNKQTKNKTARKQEDTPSTKNTQKTIPKRRNPREKETRINIQVRQNNEGLHHSNCPYHHYNKFDI